MSNENTLGRRETVRRATLQFLANRQALQFDPDTIMFRLNDAKKYDYVFTREDLDSALSFLHGSKWVERIPSTTGAMIFFRATSEGVLAVEQGQV
jgi:hypothetical protein